MDVRTLKTVKGIPAGRIVCAHGEHDDGRTVTTLTVSALDSMDIPSVVCQVSLSAAEASDVARRLESATRPSGASRTWTVLWTYLGNYGGPWEREAATAEEAADQVRRGFSDDFRAKGTVYVFPTAPACVVPPRKVPS